MLSTVYLSQVDRPWIGTITVPVSTDFQYNLTCLKERNAENKTISLNTWRGNQMQILIHCELSLKGVYTLLRVTINVLVSTVLSLN